MDVLPSVDGKHNLATHIWKHNLAIWPGYASSDMPDRFDLYEGW